MGSFAGLLKREWYEHRGAFIWVPAIWLAVILIAGFSAVTLDDRAVTTFDSHDQAEIIEKLSGPKEESSFLEVVAAMALDVAGSTDAELQGKMTSLLNGVAIPFHLVFLIVAFFVLLANLYDERKDQSVLFWKSMPVSDWHTVASKLIFVIWLAPAATIAGIILAQFFIVSLSSIFVEAGMGGRIWIASEVWLRPLGLVVRYFMLGLWALPFCGWVMLVSASAARMPVLWAIGVPWLIFLLETIIFGTSTLGNLVVQHFKVLSSSPSSGEVGVIGQLSMLADAGLWMGTFVGLVFLAATVYFRHRNNE